MTLLDDEDEDETEAFSEPNTEEGGEGGALNNLLRMGRFEGLGCGKEGSASRAKARDV